MRQEASSKMAEGKQEGLYLPTKQTRQKIWQKNETKSRDQVVTPRQLSGNGHLNGQNISMPLLWLKFP